MKLPFKAVSFNHVTRFSQLVAIVLFVGVFLLGIYLGIEYEKRAFLNAIGANLTGQL